MSLGESLKNWWATKPWTRFNPLLPGMSFGKSKEVFDKGKATVIKAGTDIIKSISLPLFLIVVIGILVLIFWKRIEKLLPLK